MCGKESRAVEDPPHLCGSRVATQLGSSIQSIPDYTEIHQPFIETAHSELTNN